MSKLSKIKKLSLMLILCSIVLAVGIGTVSATNVTVTNTDNATTIQNFISGSSSSDLDVGDTLTLNAGDYSFNKGLVINKSVNIVGNGTVRIVADSSVNISNNTIANYGIHITAPNVNLTGLTFVGWYYGISVDGTANTGSNNILIENCNASNNRRGINLDVDGLTIRNTIMSNNNREGINFNGNNIVIINCQINNNGYEGVHGHASNSILANTTINSNGFGSAGTSTMPGIDLHGHGEGVMNFTIDNCTLMYNAGEGLALNIVNSTIKNSIFSSNYGNGISIKSGNYNASNNLIYNNTITNNSKNGIEINSGGNSQNGEYSASNNNISNNIITSNANAAVVINKISPNRQGLAGYTGSLVTKNNLIGNTFSGNGIDAVTGSIEVDNTWTLNQIQNLISGSIVNIGGTNYLLSLGSTLTFTNGVYVFDRSLEINRSVIIVGDGDVWIKAGAGVNKTGTSNFNNSGFYITALNVTITGLTFTGFANALNFDGNLFASGTRTNLKIENCTLIDNYNGMQFQPNANGVVVNNCKILDSKNDAFRFDGTEFLISNSLINNTVGEGFHGYAANSSIVNCTVSNNRRGIDIHTHNGELEDTFIIERCTVTGNRVVGIAADASNMIIRNNIISGNQVGIGIKFRQYNSNNNLIENNLIFDNIGSGIEVNFGGAAQNSSWSASGNTIANNIIFNNGEYGIRINKIAPASVGTGVDGCIVENNLVYGNKILGNGKDGIFNTADKTIIRDNIIFSNNELAIFNSGNNVVLTDNNVFGNTLGGINNTGSNVQTSGNTDPTIPVEKVVPVEVPVEKIVTVEKPVESGGAVQSKDVVITPTIKTSKTIVKKGKTITVSVKLKNFGKDKSNSLKVYNKYTKKTLTTILKSGKSKTLKFKVKVKKKGINKIPIYLNGKLISTVKVKGL